MRLAVMAVTLPLVACSETGNVAERVEDRADARAEALENAGAAMEDALARNVTEQQANTIRQAGEERAEAIRESGLDADKLSDEQQNALVNAQ
jgi:hypothetical protein